MQITLNQAEIEAAVKGYINNRINLVNGTHLTIEFKAGRADNGMSATVDISEQAMPTIPTGPVKRKAVQEVVKNEEPVAEDDTSDSVEESKEEEEVASTEEVAEVAEVAKPRKAVSIFGVSKAKSS